MKSATFLLAINFSISLSFAACFLALTWRSDVRLGRWCAAGFLFATATVTIEGFADVIPSVRLTSTLSFGTLMMALTLIAIGLIHHYRPRVSVAYLVGFCAFSVVFNALVVFDYPRGSWAQALGYQMPFAAVLAIAGGVLMSAPRRRPITRSSRRFIFEFATVCDQGDFGGAGRQRPRRTQLYYQHLCILLADRWCRPFHIARAFAYRGHRRRGAGRVEAQVAARYAVWSSQSVGVHGSYWRRLEAIGCGLISLIICDLDHFKSINDRFGHAAGDEVIRAFGANLRSHFGESACCGRLGGEEFCILLPDCDTKTTCTHLEAVRLLTRQNRYDLIPSDVAVTASFGIAIMEGGEPFDRALHRADLAMYAAKAAGRDCYRFASEAMSERERAVGGGPFRL